MIICHSSAYRQLAKAYMKGITKVLPIPLGKSGHKWQKIMVLTFLGISLHGMFYTSEICVVVLFENSELIVTVSDV